MAVTRRRPIPLDTAFEAPVTTTPARRPGSIRRTTTHDSTRPEGLEGPTDQVARGRDLLTATDGTARVVDDARVEVTASSTDGILRRLVLEPVEPGTDELVGASVFGGFRRKLDASIPGVSGTGSVRAQLLDDMPVALMLSARALKVAGVPMSMDGRSSDSVLDVCAGWVTGGMADHGRSDLGPPLTVGPVAPPVDLDDDPLGWHTTSPLPPTSTRRRRRLDVWSADGLARADCFFRDSYFEDDGTETVVHEWSLAATLDPATGRFTSCEARMGPLPFLDCPGSAASAGRLVDMPLDELRRTVRKTFVGPTTCTHLNDTLRSLEDVGALLDRLAATSS